MPGLEPKINLVGYQRLRGNTKLLFQIAFKARYEGDKISYFINKEYKLSFSNCLSLRKTI